MHPEAASGGVRAQSQWCLPLRVANCPGGRYARRKPDGLRNRIWGLCMPGPATIRARLGLKPKRSPKRPSSSACALAVVGDSGWIRRSRSAHGSPTFLDSDPFCASGPPLLFTVKPISTRPHTETGRSRDTGSGQWPVSPQPAPFQRRACVGGTTFPHVMGCPTVQIKNCVLSAECAQPELQPALEGWDCICIDFVWFVPRCACPFCYFAFMAYPPVRDL
mmetsp:Transcript_6587/g.12421  ORF Transcript_6587/g.12421 Transcript_6587/m.12421 type:complete len:220 (-) Transcript_6587:668-1327(-)